MSEERYDQAFEARILSTALSSIDAVDVVARKLTTEDFFFKPHQLIFDYIRDEYSSNGVVEFDPLILTDVLLRNNIADAHAIIGNIIAQHSPMSSLEYHIQRVKGFSKARKSHQLLAAFNDEIKAAGADPSLLVQVQAKYAEKLAESTTEDTEEVFPTFDQIQDEALAPEPPAQLPSGLQDLNEVIYGGFRGGQLIIVAARPGMGKTVFGVDCARAGSLHEGKKGVFVSLEMSRKEISRRILAAEAQVSLSKFSNQQLDSADYERLDQKTRNLHRDALIILDDPKYSTWETLKAALRHLKKTQDIQFIVADYLQLMNLRKKTESRQQEISEISRDTKLLAKELDIPFVALSQLNRASEQRADKKPQISDLRESGSLEQDADMVILLHRDDYYDKDSPRAGEADIILAKHRGGPTKSIPVAFQGHYSKFADMARGYGSTASDF